MGEVVPSGPSGAALVSSSGLPTRPGDRSGSSRRSLALLLVSILVVAGALVAVHTLDPIAPVHDSQGKILVVAAENFWGSLISQLGGSRVQVLSIVSDPNADPHEYETNISDAVAIANARLVVENGAGYDDWCQQLVTSSNSHGQVILNVAQLLGKKAGDNPHFWYGGAYVNATVQAMYSDLTTMDPAGSAYYQQQYATMAASLAPMYARENEIRAKFAGTTVASTESIFQDMASSTGLDLVSPVPFMVAVSEGNDPPTASVTQFQDQLQGGNVSVLVYNAQTVTPLTQNMKILSAQHGIPIVAVTETIQPPDASFELWMESELLTLENALAQKALRL